MEVAGRIKKIFEEQTFASGFRKKEIVVSTKEQYPQDLLVEFTQEKIELLKAFKVEDEVTISINLRGREWINPEGVAKYFNSIQGWRIEKTSGTTEAPEQTLPPIESMADYGNASGGEKEDDDLPF